MSNAMMVIQIYEHCGTWAFTDKARGLTHEPFVAGIPEIIDFCIDAYGDKTKETHRIVFSAEYFPLCQGHMTKTSNEHGGAWYQFDVQDGGFKGWLCPATLKFFDSHPEKIYFAFDI